MRIIQHLCFAPSGHSFLTTNDTLFPVIFVDRKIILALTLNKNRNKNDCHRSQHGNIHKKSRKSVSLRKIQQVVGASMTLTIIIDDYRKQIRQEHWDFPASGRETIAMYIYHQGCQLNKLLFIYLFLFTRLIIYIFIIILHPSDVDYMYILFKFNSSQCFKST